MANPVYVGDPLSSTLPQPQLELQTPTPVLLPSPDTAASAVAAVAAAATSASASASALASSSASSTRLPEHLMNKNRLQEYTQRSSIPLPIYQTINEGSQHEPRFRSTVLVDGVSYTSTNTFSHRKAAEQDVAKLALKCISKKIKDEGCPLIREDTVFCKSILNEFAVKMNLEKPTYNTIQPEGLLPVFISSLVFDGVTYTGEAGRNKKEAEQLAARAVILSLLGTSGSGTMLSEIIKSKVKLYVALHKVKDSRYVQSGYQTMVVNTGHSSEILVSKDKEVETAVVTNNVPTSAISGSLTVGVNTGHSSEILVSKGKEVETSVATNNLPTGQMQPPLHLFKMPKPEPSSDNINLPIEFVNPDLGQASDVGPSPAKKRRKNKKKANKKLCTDAQLPIPALPVSETPRCSV